MGRTRTCRARSAHTRGTHVWAARTLPPDNFAKFCSRWKLHENNFSAGGVRNRPGVPGSADAGGRNENGGLPLHLFSNRISMSEWVSIVASGEHVRRCVPERAALTRRRDHSKRKQSPPLGRRGCPAAISHCRRPARARARESKCELWRVARPFDAPSNFLATWKFWEG